MARRNQAIKISRRQLEFGFLFFVASALFCVVWSCSIIQQSNSPYATEVKGSIVSSSNNPPAPSISRDGSIWNCTSMRSYQDVSHCLKVRLETNDSSCQESIESWSDIQRCFNRPFLSKPSSPPNKMIIHLIGERNTGTKFVIDQVKQCFKDSGIKVRRDFRRSKHWFQMTNTPRDQRNRILLATFRDPVEWVAAMIEKPYHSLNHMKGFDANYNPIPLDWKDFVSRPWSMPNRTEQDWKLFQSRPRSHCKYGFRFNEVMPCEWRNNSLPESVQRAYFPWYELQRKTEFGSLGIPFDNILQLRSDKILNFLLELPLTQRLGGFLAIRYEDLLRNGTRAMLEQVGEMIGLAELPASCTPQTAQPWRLGQRKIPNGLRQWVEENLILETEKLLGYR